MEEEREGNLYTSDSGVSAIEFASTGQKVGLLAASDRHSGTGVWLGAVDLVFSPLLQVWLYWQWYCLSHWGPHLIQD